MSQITDKIMSLMVEKTMKNLELNNIQAFYVPTKQDAVAKVGELLCEGDTVSSGGSMSLAEAGVLDLLKSGRYNYLDRDAKGITKAEADEIYRKVFSADAYLCSTNAVTMQGELYNVDGNSNRVSAILFGPKSVIMVVGCNKIVRDLDEAEKRVKTIAAPANAMRLSCETACAKTGECVSLSAKQAGMTAGCATDARVCCNYVVCARQRIKNRIKVILVGEPLGY